MTRIAAPGIYRQDVFPTPPAELQTGVPAFLGYAAGSAAFNHPIPLNSLADLTTALFNSLPDGYLFHAIRAFFSNGGSTCYAVRLNDAFPAEIALQQGLDALLPLDTIDLVAAPDIMRVRQPGNLKPDPVQVAIMQLAIITHCQTTGDRFALLDSLPGGDIIAQRSRLRSPNGALYYPWLLTANGPNLPNVLVPPCGHVAGIYARTDQQTGVHKAPANEILQDAVDVELPISNADQAGLNPLSINCIRSFPGRGILVWGARTLSTDTEWTYVSTRRLFLTAGRWISRNLSGFIYEPNNEVLWDKVTRELTTYFRQLFQRGALAGDTPEASFYVKCDSETNPQDTRELGMLVTEIGLRPGVPSEFIVVRLVQSASGLTISNGITG